MVTALTALGLIIGLVLGSFVKALSDRSLKNKSFWGRSYCPHCKHSLRWYDLFPVFSYLILKGKCRYCHKKIGIEYLLVEVAMGILIAFLFYQFLTNVFARSPDFIGTTWQSFLLNFPIVQTVFDLFLNTFFITILAVLTITDLKETLIPDRIVVPSILISFISLLVFTVYKIGYLYWYLNQSVLGKLLLPPHSDYFYRHSLYSAQPLLGGILTGLGIGGFFLALIIVTKGRGMGGGDVKLGAFMGLILGFPNGVLATILGFLTGAVVALVLIVSGRKKFGENIPFGPFLVLGSLITLFWGSQIIDWYLKLSR